MKFGLDIPTTGEYADPCAPFRRAAQWDGVCLKAIHHETHEWLTLDEFQACLAYVHAHRAREAPFDIIMSGEIPPDQQRGIDRVRPFAEAGATWWIEGGYDFTFEEFRARIRSGLPRW